MPLVQSRIKLSAMIGTGLLAFITLGDSVTADETLVKIGVIQSTTGLAAEDGQNVVNSVRLAAKDLADIGTKVELLIEDDSSDPKRTVTAYQALKARGVDALIVGPYGFTTDAILPFAERDKMVVFNSSALSESFTGLGMKQYFFSAAISIVEDVKPFAELLRLKKFQSAVIFSLPSQWGRVQEKAYSEALEQAGVKLLESIETVAQDSNDWGAVLPRIQSHRPDLAVLLLNKSDLDVFIQRATELHFGAALFGSKNTFDAFRLTTRKQNYEEVCFTYPLEQLRRNEKFTKRYESTYGIPPRIFADNCYDTLKLMVSAVQGSRKSGRPLVEVLKTDSFDGTIGRYSFRPETSFAISKSSLVCIREGQLIVK